MLSDEVRDSAWRAALVEVSMAQRAYDEVLGAATTDDRALDRLWLRLWRAERKRDELLADEIPDPQ